MATIKFLRDTLEHLKKSSVILGEGEVCLIDGTNSKSGTHYDSIVIGDGTTKASRLTVIPLNTEQGVVFLGEVNPTSDGITPRGFYVATTAGTYNNFGGLELGTGETALFIYKYGIWNKVTISRYEDYDDFISVQSENAVQNRVIAQALSDSASNLEDLANLVGTIPKTSSATTVIDYISEYIQSLDSSGADTTDKPVTNVTEEDGIISVTTGTIDIHYVTNGDSNLSDTISDLDTRIKNIEEWYLEENE